MSPTDIEQAAREQYNAVGDTFFSQSAVMTLIYRACRELAERAKVIERTYTASSVASQRTYAYPTNTIAIKRIEYDSVKIDPIDFREDDAINMSTSTTTVTGTPRFYAIWNYTLYLRPVPDAVKTITIYSFGLPQTITSTSTLEIPSLFHDGVVDFVVGKMAAKDQNFKAADYYLSLWEKRVLEAIRWQKQRARTDSFTTVKDEDSLAATAMGLR